MMATQQGVLLERLQSVLPCAMLAGAPQTNSQAAAATQRCRAIRFREPNSSCRRQDACGPGAHTLLLHPDVSHKYASISSVWWC